MSTMPPIDISEDIAKKSTAIELRNIIASAASKLQSLGAWDKDCGNVQILILKKGMSNPQEKPTGMQTRLSIDNEAPAGILRRDQEIPVTIEVSENLFRDEIGAKLRKLGANQEEIAFHFLAHETHHIDEVDRQAACGIRREKRGSSFVGAARPDFPEDWKKAIREFSEQYADEASLRGSLKSAGETANEAAADLVGLFWMREQGLQWAEYGKILLTYRKSCAAAEANRQASFLLKKFQAPKPFYDIHQTLDAMLAKELPDIQGIYSECWNLAIRKACASFELHDPSRSRFSKLLEYPLVLPPKLPFALQTSVTPLKGSSLIDRSNPR